MLTAFVSGIFGLVSGVVPDIIKEVRESRDHARERDFMMLQHELQMQRMQQQAGDRLEEADTNLMIEEARAFKDQLAAIVEAQARPTGIAWIDGFNAILRPASAAAIIALFVFVAMGFSDVIPAEAFTPIYIEATLAVIGFLFGYRSSRKRPVNT